MQKNKLLYNKDSKEEEGGDSMWLMLAATTKSTLLIVGKALVICAPVFSAIQNYRDSNKKG